MKAVVLDGFGSASVLKVGTTHLPVHNENEILVKLKATALNRADLLQRQGKYPPPSGASEILGLEISGIVENVGAHCKSFKTGDHVFGLVPGGGYAEYAVIHQDMALPIPPNLSFYEAAAIPEAFLTAFQALVWLGDLERDKTILIHAGASGVGTAGIQIAKQMGANCIVTASAGKHDLCKSLGASIAIDYKSGPFLDKVLAETEQKGVDLIIDFIGRDYFHQNIDCLKMDGRLVLLAAMSGGKLADFDLRKLLMRRIQILGSTLRSRSLDYQIKLSREFFEFAEPLFIQNKLKPVIDTIYDFHDVMKAHEYMESNKNAGKIVLKIA